MNKKIIFVIFLLIIVALAFLWPSIERNNQEYNKYMCATYGYKADCKTPLPANERLK